jgi:peptidoglycan hydrolase CwlO-like protein
MLKNLLNRSTMRSLANLLLVILISIVAVGQTQTAPTSPSNAALPANLSSDLDRLQAAASQANVEIAHMRIEKWKADNGSKQQAQANADSLQRNLTSALPGLISNFRAAPQDLTAGFKLYRNLNALYDVLSSFTEATGAFGPKNEYEALGQQLDVVDSVRRNLGDNLEALTVSTQSEMSQLRNQVHVLQQAAVPPAPAKKVVVDNAEPAKKPATHKKKAAATSGTTSQPGTGSTADPSPAPPKSQ